jgi:uncharacterized protein YciI
MATHRFVVRFALAEGVLDQAKLLEDEEKAYIIEAYRSGGALSIGRFTDLSKGALGIFETKEAAEAFVKDDPFVRNGVVGDIQIHEFNEVAAQPARAS